MVQQCQAGALVVNWMMSKPLWTRLHILSLHTYTNPFMRKQLCTSCTGDANEKSNREPTSGAYLCTPKPLTESCVTVTSQQGSVLSEGRIRGRAL
ncbi:hypothetical protein ATANTOWER_012011 [Ataeniobius toweri]|uniref:Uncharacterized protein n=1 Tax=Ataeniobius toweri TaxID=208326 RepID=A0ABU7BAN3_9TELE|nr:hypothetical protein [Ataeniobius toweri]